MGHLSSRPQSGASSFGEKFSRVKFSPSLTLFGGKPMEGWIAVTVSGLVTVSLLKPNGQVLTSTESLCRLRGRVALADIAFTGGGNIVVATADGSSASPVQFYKVCVSVVSEKCRIDTEILPSLFMRCTTDLNRKDKLPAITHLKFLARDMSEQVRPPGTRPQCPHFSSPVLDRESNIGSHGANPRCGQGWSFQKLQGKPFPAFSSF